MTKILLLVLVLIAGWRVERTWPGYPFVSWRWYDDCGRATKYHIESPPQRTPPHLNKLLPVRPDPYQPGVSPHNL